MPRQAQQKNNIGELLDSLVPAMFVNLESELKFMLEINKVISIKVEWEKEFKADLFEDMYSCYESISEFIKQILDEWMNVWIEENEEDREVYLGFKRKLELINLKKLSKEEKVYKK